MSALERNTTGELHFRTFPVEELGGVIEHRETFEYLGDWDGWRCFRDVDGRKIYLHPDEVLTFEPVP